MTLNLSRLAGFVAGFALWAVFAIAPWEGGGVLREGWDRETYWTIGVPILFVLQAGLAFVSGEPPLRQPLWIVLGHGLAMLMLSPPGTDFALLPISVLFVYLPGYVFLIFAAFIGRGLARAAR